MNHEARLPTVRSLHSQAIPDHVHSRPSYFLRATAYDHLRDKKRAMQNYHDFLNAANGKFPDQEWQARQRLKAIEQMR